MDVGLVVGNVGYLAALFAGLSALALAVQLGEPPTTDKSKKKRESRPHSKSKEPQIARPDQDVTFNADGKLVAGELTGNQEISLSALRKTFVDGFSGPRSKYDIALTILHEIQNDGGTTAGGSTMAAEAYLDATHSIIFTEQSDSLRALTDSSEALNPSPRKEIPREQGKHANKPSEKPKSRQEQPSGKQASKPSKSSMRRPNPRKSRSDASDPEQE